MPPKRGRGRGGSRGGRGGRGGRGRGGASGSYAPFNLSKSAKRRSRKRGHSELPSGQDTPELMDLGHSSYTSEIYAEAPLMKSLSKRPNRSLMKEARYTDKHMEQTLALTLRYRPVEFVKAETAYDPSKELIEKLIQRAASRDPRHAQEEKDEEPKAVEVVEDEVEFADEDSEKIEDDHTSAIVDDLATVEIDQVKELREANEDIHMEAVVTSVGECVEDNVDVSICEATGQGDSELKEDQVESEVESEVEPKVESEAALDDQLEAIQDDAVDQESIESISKDDTPTESREELDIDSDASDDEHEEIQFSIDQEGDSSVAKDYNVPKPELRTLLQESRKQQCTEQDPDIETGSVIEPYITVGKVMLRTLYDGYTTVELPSLKGGKSAKKGYVSFKSKQNDPFKPRSSKNTFQSSLDSDMEAAFDDYMAQLMLANEEDNDVSDNEIGADSDSGSASDYGVHDDDDEEMYEKLREQFQDFDESSDSDNISLSLLDMMELDIDDFDDLDDVVNSEEEGLEDILAFARQHKRLADLDIGSNAPPRKVGKGRKQRLELGSELEVELRESLMEQFQYQKQSRRLKKLRKKEKKRQEAEDNMQLKDKYEYSLHIKEIKQEFELFLHDANRETLSFPPLDGHGNKTLNKLANNYNMKCIKCGGNGLSMYIKVAKTKKTFRYVPDYQLIGYILKQRPVFRRADVKPRTKEEIADTDESSRRGPKSNAYVKEGDVVGALAPEIAHNNIGRKMLEMLGWSRGEGLGAMGNKGISTPVLATVKKSKTGLK